MRNLEIPLKNLDIHPGTPHLVDCDRRWRGDHVYATDNLYYVKKGSFVLNIDEHSYIVREKQLVLLPAHHHHSYWLVPGMSTTLLMFNFRAFCHDENFFEFLGLTDENHVVDVPEEEIIQCYNLIKESSLSETFISQYVMSAAQHAILCGLYAKARISLEEAKREFHDVIDFMKKHTTQDLSLDAIANAFHFNASYFAAKFKKQTGISPMKYFAQLRARYAAKLLKTTDMSVLSVASATGFSDIYYFKTFFAKHMGVRPEQFRDTFIRPPELRQTEQ